MHVGGVFRSKGSCIISPISIKILLPSSFLSSPIFHQCQFIFLDCHVSPASRITINISGSLIATSTNPIITPFLAPIKRLVDHLSLFFKFLSFSLFFSLKFPNNPFFTASSATFQYHILCFDGAILEAIKVFSFNQAHIFSFLLVFLLHASCVILFYIFVVDVPF